MAKSEETAVATVPILSDDSLRGIDSMQAALAVLRDSGVEPVNIADEMGDGFSLMENADDKRTLVKREMLILSWEFRPGDFGDDGFVSMLVVTGDGGKYRVNDGSTGIAAQLREYTERTGREHAMYLPRGFRVSDYHIHRETREPVAKSYDGPKDPASTFYLDTSK